MKTAPHLKSAFELDEALMEYSRSLESQNCILSTFEQLQQLISDFETLYFQPLRLYEYLVMDIESNCEAFQKAWSAQSNLDIKYHSENVRGLSDHQLVVYAQSEIVDDDGTFSRYCKSVKISKAIKLIRELCGDKVEEEQVVFSRFKKLIQDINLEYYKQYDDDKATIMTQIRSRAAYLRLEEHGPKLGIICGIHPLVDSYFTRLPKNEITKSRDSGELVLANNGWIWNADPLINFATSSSRAYLRRDVIPWGDCVKLRYGDCPGDSPWLWKHMGDYTLKMVSIFHGLRIDNCHSTPIHVASHFLDLARKQNPDLFVFAELFTGSEEKDIQFVSQLGISSLIREAMNAWDTPELSRLVHRQGGSPAGSFKIYSDRFPIQLLGHRTKSSSVAVNEKLDDNEVVVDVSKSRPHAIFFDWYNLINQHS